MSDRSSLILSDDSPKKPYINRPETEEFLGELEGTLRLDGARLFHVWGVGGVGKSTVLLKAREKLAGRMLAAEVSFGATEGIEEPIGLMEALAKNLISDDWGAIDTSEFTKLIRLRQDTLNKMTEDPAEKGTTEERKKSMIQLFLNLGTGAAKNLLGEEVGKDLDEIKGQISDGTTALLLEGEDWLRKHRTTKKDKELQSLILKPIPTLTTAFSRLLRGQNKPVLLMLDTYEKATQEVDEWLWRSLLANQDVGSEGLGNTRILVAGRNCLTEEREGWRKLQQDRGCVRVLGLDRFDLKQTQTYLQDYCRIMDDGVIEQIYAQTKGLPYYLNWIREEVQAGKTPDFSRGNESIANLLLQGLDRNQQRLIEIAACFRRFKKKNLDQVLAVLKDDHGVEVGAATGDLGAFKWLTDRKKMQFVEKREGHYRLDDVARDVFRLSLFEEDEELFRAVQGVIAADYLSQSQDVESEDSSYRERYENVEWRGPRAAYLYHLLLSGDRSAELVFRSHVLEARHFRVDQLVRNPLRDLVGEFGLAGHPFLRDKLRRFLVKLRPAVEQGWAVLEKFPVDYSFNENKFDIGKAQFDDAVQVCLAKPEQLTGLAQFAALIYQSGRCLESRRLDYLGQADAVAAELVDPDDDEFSGGLYLWYLGNRFSGYGNHEEAIASYDKAIEFKPDYHEAWSNRGNSLAALGRREEAIASYDKAIEVKPDYHEAWNNRGVSLKNLGRYEEAIASYDKAIEFKADDHEAWYNRGNSLAALGRWEEAIASYDKAIEFKPDLHEAWSNRGASLDALGRREEAIASYDKAIEVKPDLHEAWTNRGVSLDDLGRREEAIASYDKAIEFKPDKHEAWNNRGVSLAALGRREEALASYDKAIEFKLDKHEAWSARGNALRSLKRYEEAEASYDRAIELKPDYRWPWRGKGFMMAELQRYEEALVCYEKAIELKGDDEVVWDKKGIALAYLGRFGEAIDSYNKALEIKPDNASAIYNKACAYALQTQLAPALEHLSRAIELNPDHYRTLAQTDSDFDSLRDNEQFQALLSQP